MKATTIKFSLPLLLILLGGGLLAQEKSKAEPKQKEIIVNVIKDDNGEVSKVEKRFTIEEKAKVDSILKAHGIDLSIEELKLDQEKGKAMRIEYLINEEVGEDIDELKKEIKVLRMNTGDSAAYKFDFDFDVSGAEGNSFIELKNAAKDLKIFLKDSMSEGTNFFELKDGNKFIIKSDGQTVIEDLDSITQTFDFKFDFDGEEFDFSSLEDLKAGANGFKMFVVKDSLKEGNTFFKVSDGNQLTFKGNCIKIIEGLDSSMEAKMNMVVIIKDEDEDSPAKEKPENIVVDRIANTPIKDFKLFPNPSDGVFSIRFKAQEAVNATLSVMDVKGTQVYERELNQFKGKFKEQLDLSEEKPGIYFVTLRTGGEVMTHKIVLQK